MVKVKHIYKFLDILAPFKSAAGFDNVGLIVGNEELMVKKVLLSLDITNEVVLEALQENANLIISHHPVIFRPFKNLNFNNPVSLLVKNNINAICVHTNLDSAAEGVNFYLAKSLELSSAIPFAFEDSNPYGMIGVLKNEMTSLEFAKFVKEKLKCENLRYTENLSKIKTVAVCCGAGGDFIDKAIKLGADAFVTGEIKHSQILTANFHGVTIVDTGHFKSENIIINPLKQKLENEFKDVDFKISEVFTDKIKYL